jgi:hypothetical protein
MVKPVAELPDNVQPRTIRAPSLKMPPPRPAALADSVEPLTVNRPLALSMPPPVSVAVLEAKLLPLTVDGNER